jgi:hypothetical protein
MLFRIIKIYRMSKAGIENPENFAADEAGGFLLGLILVPVLGALIFLLFLGALAFSHFWGGPYAVAKVFFFFLLIPYAVFAGIIITTVRIVKKMTKAAVEKGKDTPHVTLEEIN